MTLLILGLALWIAAHLFKRLAPNARAALGDKGRGIVALLILLSVVLMVIGYRSADGTFYWGRSPALTGVNNLLMIFAVFLMGLGSSKSRLRSKMRHPMLTGAFIWSIAHLLVNGDTASFILFGGIGAWAILEMLLINRAEKAYQPYQGGSLAGDIRLAAISAVVFAVIAGIHTWLGYMPFG